VPAAARLLLTGCVLCPLLLAGCGGGSPDPTGSAPVTSRESTTVAKKPQQQGKKKAEATPGGPCQGQLGSFVASMDSLRRRLAVGLTYDQYVAEVRGIRSTYGKIPIDRVEIDCLAAVGTSGEQAFNRYIEAADDWGECVSEAGCSSAAVEPALQRRWRLASHFLTGADEGLNASAP
jgi:hypothetical protein